MTGRSVYVSTITTNDRITLDRIRTLQSTRYGSYHKTKETKRERVTESSGG